MPKNRSPLSSNGGGGSSFARWSTTSSPSGGAGSRPCQTYENLDFLYRNPPTNSAPSGASAPPPLPAKIIQRGGLMWNLKQVWFKSSDLKFSLTMSPPQVVQTPRFQSQRRNARQIHDDPLTRPPTPVHKHKPEPHLYQVQKAKAKGENLPSPLMDREVCSGDRSRAGRATLVLVLVLKAASLRTTSGLSGEATLAACRQVCRQFDSL